jgi:hypothetical protein
MDIALMENSNGTYPPGSLSHLIGKRLEEVHRNSTNPRGGKLVQSWEPWVSDSKREHLSHRSVRRSGSIACVQLR